MKYKYYINLTVLIFMLLCTNSAYSQNIELVESNLDRIVLNIHFPDGFLVTMLKDYSEYSEAEGLYTINRLIGLPPGKSAELSLVEGEPYNKDISGDLRERISELESPEDIADIRPAGGFRGLLTASLTINPIIIDAGTRSVRFYNSIRIVISFVDTDETTERINLNDDHQPMIDKLMNGSDVTDWVQKGLYKSSQVLQKTAADSAAWFEPGRTYYKLTVDREGLFTINPDFLEDSLDISPGSVIPQNIKIYNKGGEIPLYVSGEGDGAFNRWDDYVVFYGDFNRGEGSYYDLYTDENAYWLTFEGGPGLRMEVVDGTPAEGIPHIESFTDTLHLEVDEDYFQGLTTPGIENTNYVAGERWAWQRFSSVYTLTRDFGFVSENKLESEDPVTLRLAVTGFTAESQETTERHHVEFYLNDQLIYDVVFYGSADTVLEVSVANELVNSGSNKITITSVPSTDGRDDGFYLDWFEVIYEHTFRATNNRLDFSLDLSGNVIVTIDGFSIGMPYIPSRKKCVFNITQSSVVDTNMSIGGNYQNYSIEFMTRHTGSNKFMILDMFMPHFPAFDSKIEFQNLWDNSNAADYLIISHEKFLNQANSFAEYRQGINNFANGIKVIDVEDIYNQFNYGMKDPQAIRDFLTKTRDWSVMPSYVLLIGDASWDPKLNDPESEAVDYVPTYGYPASDAWFTLTDGDDDIIPDLYIGRIPVTTAEEFDNVFNKIQEYESAEPDEWQKKVLFLNGGKTSFEQIMLRSTAERVGSNLIDDHPFSGKDIYFNKTSPNDIEYGFKEDIIREINDGALWVNSMGHASSEIYDVDFGTVDDLSNTGLYPFMVSMSCNTGRFANPFVTSIVEKYTLAKDKGAIGYFATTGWGRINSDNVIIYDFFENLFEDGTESLGEAMTMAKIRLYDYSTSAISINLVWQYSLIGDPAMKLSMIDTPDFALKEGDIVLEKEDPSESDSPLEVKVYIRNYGLSVEDTVSVELFDVTDPQNPEQAGSIEYLYKNGYIDSTVFNYNLVGRSGVRTLKAVVNRAGAVEEYSTMNNEVTEEIRIFSTNAVTYYPQNLTAVRDRQVTLKAIVPKYRISDITNIYFEVDTSSSFESPLIQSEAVPEGEFFTEYKVNIPSYIEVNSPIYWRVRNINDGVSADWRTSVFYIDTLLDDSVERWQQTGRTFDSGVFVNTGLEDTSRSVTLFKQPVEMIVESAGFFDGLFHALVLNGSEIESVPYDTTLLETLIQGIYIAQVDQKTGELIDSYHFNTHVSTEHSEGLAEYINGISNGRIVLAAVEDEAANNITDNAKDALKTIGSELIDDLDWRDSWAIIGRKGAAPGTVTEALKKRGEGRVGIQDSLMVYPVHGTFTSPIIKGASKWLSMSAVLNPTSYIPENSAYLSVYGYNLKQKTWEKLIDSEYFITKDLSNIDAQKYPELRFEAGYISLDRNPTAGLFNWAVEYEPGNDYYTNADYVSLSADSVMQGSSLDLSGQIFRSAKGELDTIKVGVKARNTGEKEDNYSGSLDIIFPDTDTLKSFSFSIPTYGLSGSQEIIVEIDPDNDKYEISELNNLGFIPVFFEVDPYAPEIEITMDDKDVQDEDYVSDSPEIRITITENSGHTISDTSLISLGLDNVPIALINNSLVSITYDAGASRTEILYTPQLEHGEHSLSAAVKDRNNNQTQAEIDFTVASGSRIEEFYPIPNPFSDRTYFTYKLTSNFDDVSIRIYTVRGRLIRNIDYAPVGTGFNRVEWDGRDQDGDLVANGVYICRIIGRMGDTSSVMQTKVAVIR